MTRRTVFVTAFYTQSNFYMQSRWGGTQPLGQIAHSLQAFRPNGLVDLIL